MNPTDEQLRAWLRLATTLRDIADHHSKQERRANMGPNVGRGQDFLLHRLSK